MALTPLPDPPQTSDPANFATKADALVAALATMVAEINAGAIEYTGGIMTSLITANEGISIPTGKTLSGAGGINISGSATVASLTIPDGVFIGKATGQKSWQIDAGATSANVFSITPSTATDGTTFTTPMFQLSSGGVLTFTGSAVLFNDLAKMTWGGAYGAGIPTISGDLSGGGGISFSRGGSNGVSMSITSNGVTVASLAGTGTRHVMVDANGVMSAP